MYMQEPRSICAHSRNPYQIIVCPPLYVGWLATFPSQSNERHLRAMGDGTAVARWQAAVLHAGGLGRIGNMRHGVRFVRPVDTQSVSVLLLSTVTKERTLSIRIAQNEMRARAPRRPLISPFSRGLLTYACMSPLRSRGKSDLVFIISALCRIV